MQRVTPGIGDAFRPVEKALRDTFMPDLLHGVGEGTLGKGFIRLKVKQAGLALLDPTKTAPNNWTTFRIITGHLVAALRGQEDFRAAEHAAYLRKGR